MIDKRTVVDSSNGDPISGCTLKAYRHTGIGAGELIGTYTDDGDGNYYLDVKSTVQVDIGIVNPNISTTEMFPTSLKGVVLIGDDILDLADGAFDTECNLEITLDDKIGDNYVLMGGKIATNGTDGAFLYQYGISSQVYKNHLYITWPYSKNLENTSDHDPSYSGIQVLDYNMVTGEKKLYQHDTVNTQGELHQTPTLTISDDEHIIVAYDKLVSGGHNGGIQILRSTNKLDVSAFDEITTLSTGYGSYPSLSKNKNGRIVCDYRGYDGGLALTRGISYSDDNGQTWSSPFKFINTSDAPSGEDQWAYAANDVRRSLGDKFITVLAPQNKNNNGRTEAVYILVSKDGLTWTNFDGSFSRTFTAGDSSNPFTFTELENHFKITDNGSNLAQLYYTSFTPSGNLIISGRFYDYGSSTSTEKILYIAKVGRAAKITEYVITLPSITNYNKGFLKWSIPLSENVILAQSPYSHSGDKTKDINVGFIITLHDSSYDMITFDLPNPDNITNTANGISEFNFANTNDHGGNGIYILMEQRGGIDSYGESKLFAKKVNINSGIIR